MKILIIANAHYKGGMSGSDNIYMNFVKHWPASTRVWQMQNIDYKPFIICYIHRIILSCLIALLEPQKYSFVYSASDFLMDSLPGFIMKLKGNKWVASMYLYADKKDKIYYHTQNFIVKLLKRYADVVSITNSSMKWRFADKPTVEINGGIDFALAGLSNDKKIYDAVFCSRIHKSKGIDELLKIWALVRAKKPDARLALIGDGDMGLSYIRNKIWTDNMGIDLLGYMADERYSIYKKSKITLYTATYDHFSVAPVEGMACGCPMVAFNLRVMKFFEPQGTILCNTIEEFANAILKLLNDRSYLRNQGKKAFKWSHIFDWKKQTMRVYRTISKELGYDLCST
jgi:glycosyltransferase involved in cell wall biosynthesis